MLSGLLDFCKIENIILYIDSKFFYLKKIPIKKMHRFLSLTHSLYFRCVNVSSSLLAGKRVSECRCHALQDVRGQRSRRDCCT